MVKYNITFELEPQAEGINLDSKRENLASVTDIFRAGLS